MTVSSKFVPLRR